MSKKNLLIVLDQGLGDAIASIGVMDLIAKKMVNYNIIIMGTAISVQVISSHIRVHNSYIISRGGDFSKRISTFYDAMQFIKKSNIDESIRMVTMRRGIFYALYAFFTRLLNVKYPYYITALLYFSKCKNIRKSTKGSYKFSYPRKRVYQHLLEYTASLIPEYFQNVDFTDPTFCVPRMIHEKHIFTKPTIGIHPGTSKGDIVYPVEFYADVAFRLAIKNNCDIAIFSGNAIEIQFGEKIFARLVNLGFETARIFVVPQVGYKEFCNYISSLSLLICNDSGPMHLASAFNVPVCVYPSVGMLEVLQQWYPYVDGEKYVVLSAQDLQISYSKFHKRIHKKFKLLYSKMFNIEQVVNDIVKKVEIKSLL